MTLGGAWGAKIALGAVGMTLGVEIALEGGGMTIVSVEIALKGSGMD
jgi:hypothetical protein